MTVQLHQDPPLTLSRTLPPDTAVAVIADVHGEIDLLDALRSSLMEQLLAQPATQKHLIFLGDVTDRGQDSRAALELVRQGCGDPSVAQTWLLGNHEMYLRDLLAGTLTPNRGLPWMAYWGGGPLVEDFGVAASEDLATLGQRLRGAVPADLLADLQARPTHLRLGELVFVHAGVDPGSPLESQGEGTLCWIREPFLSATAGWPHPFVVIHGHTIEPAPTLTGHRLGLDTGAYQSGCLTGALIVGNQALVTQAITTAPRRWLQWAE